MTASVSLRIAEVGASGNAIEIATVAVRHHHLRIVCIRGPDRVLFCGFGGVIDIAAIV